MTHDELVERARVIWAETQYSYHICEGYQISVDYLYEKVDEFVKEHNYPLRDIYLETYTNSDYDGCESMVIRAGINYTDEELEASIKRREEEIRKEIESLEKRLRGEV